MKLHGTVFFVALALRIAVGVFQIARAADPNQLEFPDEHQYWNMAQAFSQGEGLPDELGFQCTRMPLYPVLLSSVAPLKNGVIFAKVVQWVIGAVTAVLAAALAARLFDRTTAWIGGFAVACDPFLVFSTSLLLTETLYILFVLGLWWAAGRLVHPQAGLSGVTGWLWITLFGVVCLYVRESALVLIGMLMFWIVVTRYREREVWFGVAIVALVTLAALIPWALRNRAHLGEWCWLTTRGGISLYDGVGPQATGASDLGDVKQMPAVVGLSEAAWNRYFMTESIRAIKSDPVRILHLAVVKLKRTWNPFPNVGAHQSRWVRGLSAGWSVPIFALAAVACVVLVYQGRNHLVFFLLLPAIHICLLHSVFVGSVRYRLPAAPIIDLLSAFSLVMLFRRLRRERRMEEPSLAS